MGFWRGVILCGVLAAALACLTSLVSCSSVPRAMLAPPEIPGASFVGNAACRDCHAEIFQAFPASPHARLHTVTLEMKGEAGCESCHGPASRHIAMPYSKERLIVNPGRDPAACLQCHVEVHADFRRPHHHPVFEGQMNCVQCHDPHGRDIHKAAGGLAMARLNEACATCHREQARPVVFEHEAMREGCTACHHPHGSHNRAMLVQPDNNLCLKCHAQTQMAGSSEILIGGVPHRSALLLQRGTCWSAGCHTAVHGSNVNPLLRY